MNFVLNKSSLKKELYPLMLPWSMAVVAGGTIGVRPLLEWSDMKGLLLGLAVYGFFGGLAMLAATAFGSELQERTVGLLLTQPLSRSRMWARKMIALTLAILVAGLAESALLAAISAFYPNHEIRDTIHELLPENAPVFAGMFLLATVCSCTFWTLVAGSTLGGLVFAVAGQFLATLAAAFVLARLRGEQEFFQDAQTLPAIVLGGLVYSVVFFYLGWRKFVRLEVRAPGPGAGGTGLKIFSWNGPGSRLLVSQPTTRILNLIRKELRLQKPIVQLAGVFLLCWAGILILQFVRPNQNITYLFDVITCIYAPLSGLLIGCLSLGEERAMGTTATQLVLPISSSLQWLIKLMVCLAAAAGLGLAFPFILFWVNGPMVNLSASGLMNHNDNGLQALVIISGLMFVLGYWASSLTANTVRAALVAVAAIIVLPICAVAGIKSSYLCFGVPPNGLSHEDLALKATVAVVIVLLLGQSLIRFQRSEERNGKLLVYSIIIVALTFFVSFCATS